MTLLDLKPGTICRVVDPDSGQERTVAVCFKAAINVAYQATIGQPASAARCVFVSDYPRGGRPGFVNGDVAVLETIERATGADTETADTDPLIASREKPAGCASRQCGTACDGRRCA